MATAITSTEAINLAAAANAILVLIDKGELVRNTDKDHEPGWSIRALEVITKIKALQEAVAAIPLPEDEIPF